MIKGSSDFIGESPYGIVVVGMFLVCHVILQDHIIKGLHDFMGGSP